MHSELKQVFDNSVILMEADNRVLAGFVSGSAGTFDEDEYSDVDAVFIVRSGALEKIVDSLPDFFASLSDSVELIWAERYNTPQHHNYAVLFRIGDNLLQYDISIDSEDFKPGRKVLPGRILFDKSGLLQVVDEMDGKEFSSESLRWHIEAYWIWIYTHAKYLKRRDFVKLVYVQQELFNNHLVVLGNLYRQTSSLSWWPQAVKSLPYETKRDNLMKYLCHPNIDSISEKLTGQIEVFSSDAKDLCRKFNIEYPYRLEEIVLDHLNKIIGK